MRAAAGGKPVLLGGEVPEAYDTQQALRRDTRLIVPIGLALILVILAVLLRAVVMPLYVIATVAERTSDELALMMAQFLGFHGFAFDEHITGVAVCSGVPRVTGELREMTDPYA